MSASFDLIVAGAGPSGICAALAAARAGLRVLLAERSSQPGGSNTQSLVCPLMGFHAGKAQVVRGIAQEIIDRLAARGGTLGHIPDPLGVASSITPIEPELLRQVYFEMLRETPGLTLLLHTYIVGAETEDGWIRSIATAGKDGERRFHAPLYIDATGDGDLACFAGARFTEGRVQDGLAQPMTLVMKLGGVSFERIRADMRDRPDQFVLAEGAERMPYTAVSGYFEAVADAAARGELTFPRDRVLLFQGVREDEAFLNMSRVVRCSAIDALDLTRAEAEGHRQADEILGFLRRNIDAFKDARLIETGAAIGVRESRHILGRYTLTPKDIFSEAEFDDAVAVGAFPMDIHDPAGGELRWNPMREGQCYDIPYRTMLPEGLRNLLMTGRPISATHEAAASCRVTPTVMALGQAAGLAASLADAGDFTQVDVQQLREKITATGGVPGRRSLEHG